MSTAKSVRRTLTASGLIAAAALSPLGATAAAAQSGRLCGPPTDTVPPQVTAVTLSTSSVDVTNGPATITVTADATDNASGVKQLFVETSGPGSYVGTKLHLVSGTSTDGEWQGTLTIPQTARAGAWQVRDVRLTDADRNEQEYNEANKHDFSPTDINLQSGWQTAFTVTNNSVQPPPSNRRPGRLTDFKFSPSTVNATEGTKRVHVTAAFASPRPKRVRVEFEGDRLRGRRFYRGVVLKPTTTDKYAGTLKVKQWSGNTTAAANLTASYGATTRPSYRSYQSAQLAARHFPVELKIRSGTDRTDPTLTDLSFTPNTVDTTDSHQTVAVTADATDSQSGVKDLSIRFLHRGGGFGYAYARLKRSGGQWVGTVNFRQCVAAGAYKVYAQLSDRAGNYKNVRPHALAAAGLPASLSVTSTPGDITPPEITNATASGPAHTITLNFSEGVKNVTDSTLTVYPMKPASTRFTAPADITAVACGDGTDFVPCDGSGGLVTSAVLDVAAVTGGAHFQIWANQNEVTPQLTDNAGNPMRWGYSSARVTGS